MHVTYYIDSKQQDILMSTASIIGLYNFKHSICIKMQKKINDLNQLTILRY